MEKKDIKKFIESYNRLENSEIKDKAIKALIKRRYVPFLEKVGTFKSIIEGCEVSNGCNVIVYSPTRYIGFKVAILALYTNIETSSSKISHFELYDAAKQSGLMDKILEAIGVEEYEELAAVEQMVYSDYMALHCSMQGYITRCISKIKAYINHLKLYFTSKVKSEDFEKIYKKIEKEFNTVVKE